MNAPRNPPHSRLSHHTANSISYRDRDLVTELLGRRSFVEVFFLQLLDREPSPAEIAVLDAVLVTLMEHGLTPSAIAARLVYSSSPETLQSGVAAGLLAVGSRFVGTMEDCARLLGDIVAAPDATGRAHQIAREYRSASRSIPGFGHHMHRPDDPRAVRLLELARELKVEADHAAALEALASAVDAVAGRHITINATGAAAAVLGDIGMPARWMRGVAVLSRAAGLVTHIAEEQQTPTDRFIWELVDTSISRQE